MRFFTPLGICQLRCKTSHSHSKGATTQFQVSGWAKDPAVAPSGGKVKVETLSSFSRDFKIRAKTATPAVIAKYLSDFIADVARRVPPKWH